MTDTDFIKSVVKLGNESYQAGYEQGLREGKRQAYAEFQKIVADTFASVPKPEQTS